MEQGNPRKTPVDIANVIIDMQMPKTARIKSYLKQVKDPYAVMIDGVLVEMEYTDDGPSMQELVDLAAGVDRW